MTKQELIDILINDFKLMFPETNKWQREQLMSTFPHLTKVRDGQRRYIRGVRIK